jgi:hypothetical protein
MPNSEMLYAWWGRGEERRVFLRKQPALRVIEATAAAAPCSNSVTATYPKKEGSRLYKQRE